MLSLEKFKRELDDIGISINEKLLLAVSGGVDSMVLWHLFHQLNLNYSIAHVNFCLREEASEMDFSFVKEATDKRKVTFYVKSIDTKAYAKEHRLSIQMAARAIRYQWFDELKSKYKYQSTVTAHHLDDSVETFFINLNRGTGLKGLQGISSKKGLIRPLLSFTKEEILDYAKQNNVAFREDQSNAELKYERNWFRHKIIKTWKEKNPDFLASMKQTMDHLRVVQSQFEDYMKRESSKLKEEMDKGFLSIQSILQSKEPNQVLYHLLGPLGISFGQIQQLVECLINKRVGRQFLTQKYRLNIDRTKIFIEEREKDSNSTEIRIEEGTKVINRPVKMSFEDINTPIDIKSVANTEFVDKEKLNYPLEIRSWKEGDWMIPLGMKGKKKISDILVDEKIPLKDKKNYQLLCSDNQVVWLIGLRLDDRFKLIKSTKEILKIEWKKNE